MANIPDSWALLKSLFHALGKANISINTHPNAAIFKSLGIISKEDVIIDSLPWVDWNDERNGGNKLTNWAAANPLKLKKYDKVQLTPVPTSGSNSVGWQAYYFDANLGGTYSYGQAIDTFVKPWISPVDVSKTLDNQWLYNPIGSANNMPATAYQAFLYKAAGQPNADAPLPNTGSTSGIWLIDYYAGMVYFGDNQRPGVSGCETADWCILGTNSPRMSFWHYTGKTLDDMSGLTPNEKELLQTETAGENLSGHRAVFRDTDNKVYYASSDNLAHRDGVLGITTQAANINTNVEVRTFGELIEPTWNWTPNKTIWLGLAGQLVQTRLNAGFLLKLGYASGITKMFIDIEESTNLI